MIFEIIDGRKTEAIRKAHRERMRKRWLDPAFRERMLKNGSAARKIDRQKDPKALRMAQMYREGKTLVEIGDEFGITRERVRQLIQPLTHGRKGGGKSVAAQRRAIERKRLTMERRDSRAREEFGCDYETVFRLNGNRHPTYNDKGTLANSYLNQKRTMRGQYVGVEYSLTFPQWIEIWGDKIHLRGRGKFALCRIDPTKGFTADNVLPMEMREKASETMKRTNARIQKIRSLEEAGCSNEQIAAQLGVTTGYLESLRLFCRRMLP